MTRPKTQINYELFPFENKKYSEDLNTLMCPDCYLYFQKDKCPTHTTSTGLRTYPICPVCKTKQPMRSKPRCRRFYKMRHKDKRI